MQLDDGGVQTYETREEVEEFEVNFTENHMDHGDKWHVDELRRELPEFRSTKRGRAWRERLMKGTLSEEEWECIPAELREVFRVAAAEYKPPDERMKKIFSTAPSFLLFERYLRNKKKNTAPGKSGLRIDLIAGACEKVRKMVWKLISIPYLTGYMYNCWADEIVNWVPKEEGNNDAKRRRPLMYYEVLRKACMGVKKGKVMALWREMGKVDEDNYAFMQHLSTAEPIMIKKMIAEEARRYGKKLKMVDVDFSKAYDTTEKYAKDISLMFMGMCRRGRRMWQYYDTRRRMRVRRRLPNEASQLGQALLSHASELHGTGEGGSGPERRE